MSEFKSGYISVIGVPNAGKSSLVNAMVKESVSIVTAKPQTTRKRTLGIISEPERYQMIFIDTPGVIESDAGLNTFLRHELEGALKNVDVVVAAIAPWEFEKTEKPWALEIAQKINVPVIYVATQGDKKEPSIQKRLEAWTRWMSAEVPLYFTSSKTGIGLKDLQERLCELLPQGPQYYDTDLFTPQSMREISTETIRKQCFELLHQEIPYGLAVALKTFEETPKIFKIEADIVLSKDSHKGMVIGRQGQMLKTIGERARLELEKTFDQKIFLKLHVVVKPHWIKDKQWLEELGYVSAT